MSYHLLIIRDTFTETNCTGKLFLNGNYFCHTLEDVSRGEGIKIDKKTCIPTGTYLVDVTFSQRFQRDMPMIYNQDNGYELINKGISFKGIRLHGGNTHENTKGCPLIAKNRLNDNLIQGTMEKPLTGELKRLGNKGYITIVNEI